jgi:hypothetical protein
MFFSVSVDENFSRYLPLLSVKITGCFVCFPDGGSLVLLMNFLSLFSAIWFFQVYIYVRCSLDMPVVVSILEGKNALEDYLVMNSATI